MTVLRNAAPAPPRDKWFSYRNRSTPPSLKSKLGSLLVIAGFIYYVWTSGLGWAAGDSPFLSGFYTIVCAVTVLIMLSGVFWCSYTHLPPARGRVIAIIPIFNEDPELLHASIWSLINQTRPPDQIHIIDDGSARPIATFDHPLVTWHYQENAGKRHAQANILRRFSPNQWDYIFTVDSDSVLDPDALEHMLRAMSDPTVQAATGMIFVRNWKDNLVTRITDINVVVACQMLRQFRSWFGLVTPTSGALAIYRAALVYDNLDDYVTSGTAGDDRRLSFYALMRGKVVGVHEAVVETALPNKWGKVFNQRLRWSKSAWLGIPFVLTNLNMSTVILYMYPLVFALLWPWVAGFLIYTASAYGDKALWAGVLFWVIVSVCMTAIYSLYRPSFTWKERLAQFALSPIYPIFGLVILRPASYWALKHLKSNSWHTQGLWRMTSMRRTSESTFSNSRWCHSIQHRSVPSRLVALSVVGLILGAGAACARPSTQPVIKDSFGIIMLHRPVDEGMSWHAQWNTDRKLNTTTDPSDPWFTMSNSTSSFYSVENGHLVISGRDPRMYVREPGLNRQWRNVEITMYFFRRTDDNTPYAGMVAVARSNHGATGSVEKNPCDSRGYGSRIRYDGTTDFEKEISHPHNDAHRAQKIWNNGMPFNKWIGYKFLVYDLPNGTVKLEQWLDESEGANGGNWRLVNELIDDGTFWGDGIEPCKSDIDPKMPLTSKPTRPGSESGKPNVSVYFRSDTVNTRGLFYKYGSIREITP